MTEFLEQLQQELVWANGSRLELLAVVCSVAYVLLAAARKIACWPAGLIASLIYIPMMWDLRLYMDAALHGYYAVMAVYGFWVWRGLGNKQTAAQDEQPVVIWSWKRHLGWGVFLTTAACSTGWILDAYTDADFAYLDSLTTAFALFATYLTTRKVLENWIYWIVLDIVWAWLYSVKGIPMTSGLMVFYVFVATYGLINWYGRWKRQKP